MFFDVFCFRKTTGHNYLDLGTSIHTWDDYASPRPRSWMKPKAKKVDHVCSTKTKKNKKTTVFCPPGAKRFSFCHQVVEASLSKLSRSTTRGGCVCSMPWGCPRKSNKNNNHHHNNNNNTNNNNTNNTNNGSNNSNNNISRLFQLLFERNKD